MTCRIVGAPSYNVQMQTSCMLCDFGMSSALEPCWLCGDTRSPDCPLTAAISHENTPVTEKDSGIASSRSSVLHFHSLYKAFIRHIRKT